MFYQNHKIMPIKLGKERVQEKAAMTPKERKAAAKKERGESKKAKKN